MIRLGSNALLLRKQQIWVYVVGILFVLDFLFYGYLPSHRQLELLQRAKGQHTQRIEAAASQEAMLPTLEERLAEAKATVKRYEGSIPSESALGLFMRQIGQIMAAHDLANQEVIPSQATEAGELQCIPVHMKCTGTLGGLFGFFQDLQGLGRLVRIEKTSFRNDAQLTGQITMQTEAVIFYRPSASQEASPSDDQTALEVVDNDA